MLIHTTADAQAAERDLKAANVAYYTDVEAMVLTDAQYDELKSALVVYYDTFPSTRPIDSVIDHVGAPLPKGAVEVAHATPMLSLSNRFTNEDVGAFCGPLTVDGSLDIFGELKLDGLSLSLTYQNNRLVRAATRGDGKKGEDVTNRMGRVRGVPLTLPDDFSSEDSFEIRGETCMLRSVFADLNARFAAEKKDLASNPRNAAAGTLRRDATLEGAYLDFFAYQVVGVNGPVFARQSTAIEKLKAAGFFVSPMSIRASSMAELLAWYEEVQHARADLPMDIDGVVYKVDSSDVVRRLGARSTSPRWATAHKFPPDKVWTTITAIDLQIGRSGILAPVARLDPIMVGGVVVSNATLHNRDYIEGRNSAGESIRDGVDIRVGDTVEVFRAGDVIPKVGGVDLARRPADSAPFVYPTACPECGGPVNADGSDVKCMSGTQCGPQRLHSFVHALAREALDADGVSVGSLTEWVKWDWIHCLADLFTLAERHGASSADPLEKRSGWGPVSANRAFKAIEKARSTTMERALYALGMPLVGRSTSRDLAIRFPDWESFLDDVLAGCVQISELAGVGPKAVQALMTYWTNPATRDPAMLFLSGLDIDNPLHEQASSGPKPLEGWTIVFTGTFPGMSRDAASAAARSFGASVSGSVSKNTTLVVAGEKAGTKRQKAEGLGVRVCSPEEWESVLSAVEGGKDPLVALG